MPPNQIGRRRSRSLDDAVGVAFADRDFIDADHCGPWRAGARQLRSHILLFQFLDRMPMKIELLADVLDRCLAATPANKVGKALGVKWIVGEKIEPFAFHFTSIRAASTSSVEFEIDPRVAA